MTGNGLSDVTSIKIFAEGLAPGSFPVSWDTFIVPSLTSSDGQYVPYTVAIPQTRNQISSTDLKIKVASPVPQPLTLGPRLITGD